LIGALNHYFLAASSSLCCVTEPAKMRPSSAMKTFINVVEKIRPPATGFVSSVKSLFC
jgi:hypothetical protein